MVVLEWSPFQASWDFKKSYYTHTMRGCPALELYSIHVNLCVAVATGVNPDLTLFLTFKNVFLHYSVMAVLVIYCTVLVNTQTRAHQQKFNICSRRNTCTCASVLGHGEYHKQAHARESKTQAHSHAPDCVYGQILNILNACENSQQFIVKQKVGQTDWRTDRQGGRQVEEVWNIPIARSYF